MQSIKDVGHSLDSVADSEHSRVTLTRFSARPSEQHNAARSTSSFSPNRSSNLSAGDLLPGSAFGKERPTLFGFGQAQRCDDADRAHFQIVWRQLSFQVDTGSYDKLISNTFSRLSSVFERAPPDLEEYSTPNRQPHATTKKKIFENLNGHVKSGEITAILGPSGAGKTSLLNALCGRAGNYRGTIQLLGGPQGKKMRSSIIPQKDYLIEKLTVRECLLYASKILNSARSFDHEANIHRVVKMLKLSACLDSSISRISGGEYKRVSIAQELLSQPDILILDEPTSGLDSLNCKNLIRSLSSLLVASLQESMRPMAIVMTIHQPDIEVFNMFDHVYCMARGGKVLYDGRPEDAIQVIRSRAQSDCPSFPIELQLETSSDKVASAVNPANLLIEIASGEYGTQPIESLARLQREQFEAHSKQLNELLSTTNGNGTGSSPNLDRNGSTKSEVLKLTRDKRLSPTRGAKKNSFFYLTNLLARRAFLAIVRDPMISLNSLGFYLLMPLVMYVVFPQTIGTVRGCPVVVRDIETLALASNQTLGIVADLQEQLSASIECATMFFVTIYSFSVCSIAVAALTFPINMHVLLKEARNGWYGLSSFVTAESIASLPFLVLFPAMSIVMVYQLLNMPSSYLEWRMWTLALVVVLQSMISQTTGLIFGALCMNSVQTAIFIGISSTFPLLVVSGFFARIKQMPRWLGTLSHLSPYRYVLHMTNMIRFGFGLCPCDESTVDYLHRQPPQFTDIPTEMASLFSYYLTSTAPDGGETNSSASEADERVLGIFYDLKLNSSERANILGKLESNEIDVFKQMAQQLTRSFSFGQSIEGCDTARAQVLNSFDTPHDHQLPMMFAYVIGLLVVFRIVLFLSIKFRVYSQI